MPTGTSSCIERGAVLWYQCQAPAIHLDLFMSTPRYNQENNILKEWHTVVHTCLYQAGTAKGR